MKTIFKVQYGYKSTDYVLIDNDKDLQRAIYARVEKIPVFLGGKMISGQEIKTIEPDIHSYTGWHRSYLPMSGDDFKQIERDVPRELYDVIDECHRKAELLLHGKKQEEPLMLN